MAQQNYKNNETVAEATERLGKWGRFLVWNSQVYAFESFDPVTIAPIEQSSGYKKHQVILDVISTKLSISSDGAWVYIRSRQEWYHLPLSLREIHAIAAFDLSVMDFLLINTPKEPLFPT
jgi:hypothetical protein